MARQYKYVAMVPGLVVFAFLVGCATGFNEVDWKLGPGTNTAGQPGARLHHKIAYIGRDTDDPGKTGQKGSFASKTFSCAAPGWQQNTFCNVKISFSLFHASGEKERLKISATPAGGVTKDYFIDDATTSSIHSSNTKTETIAVPCKNGCKDEVTIRFELTEGSTRDLQGQTHVDITAAMCDLSAKTNAGGHLSDVHGNDLPGPKSRDSAER